MDQAMWIVGFVLFFVVINIIMIAMIFHYRAEWKWALRELDDVDTEAAKLDKELDTYDSVIEQKDQTIGYLKALTESKDAEISRLKVNFADTLDSLSVGDGRN